MFSFVPRLPFISEVAPPQLVTLPTSGERAVFSSAQPLHQDSLGVSKSAAMSLIAGCALAVTGHVNRRSRRVAARKQLRHGRHTVVSCESTSSTTTLMESVDTIMESVNKNLLNNYGKRNILLTHGEGHYAYDADGNKLLDFAAGIAVNCLGHADPGWVDVVSKQAGTLVHTSNMYLNAPQVRLAENLVKHSFADKAFFCNSGTEANEAAIKFSRRYHYSHGHPRERFVAFDHAFHGRTMGALALTWKEKYKTPFQPVMPSVDFLPYNDVAALDAIDDTVCGVFVEPVQGEGGCIPGTSEFLEALRKRCDEVGAILIFDEVQCGLGRMGKLFAYELSGVVPDIVTLAKPLAGGLPIGGCVLSEKVAETISPGDHGSTFAGAPLVCAAANYTIERIANDDFLANVSAMGNRLREGLRAIAEPFGCTVRGEGLLNGIVCPSVAICSAIQKSAQDHGLMVLTAGDGDVIRLAPALTVTSVEIDLALACLEKAFASVEFPASPAH